MQSASVIVFADLTIQNAGKWDSELRAFIAASSVRITMHFTPTSASWLNMVDRFFRDISEKRLRRGVFTSVPELTAAVDEYVAHHNNNPKPFIWTQCARDIPQNGRLAG